MTKLYDPSRGTEGSNPASSSGESTANPVGLAQVEWPVRRRRSPIATPAKTDHGGQFFFVNEPELDHAIFAAAGQPLIG